MSFTTMISAAELAQQLENPDWAIIDTRFILRETERGESDYLAAHIPGAVYAHLDRDLSSPHIVGQTGRHPLPPVAAVERTLGSWGIDEATQVVVYDTDGMIAGRLWWMLRWLGHNAVAVLDGGWPQWQQEGRPTRTGRENRVPRQFVARERPELVVTADEIEARLGDPALHLFDARKVERFRGENETLDPVGGHIPGAVSAPYAENLGADGLMLSPQQLRARFENLLGDTPAAEAIFYCGSGVSVAHDVLALQHAGLQMPRVYVGSWSDWVSTGKRPIEQG